MSRRLNACMRIQCVPGALLPLPLAPGYQASIWAKWPRHSRWHLVFHINFADIVFKSPHLCLPPRMKCALSTTSCLVCEVWHGCTRGERGVQFLDLFRKGDPKFTSIEKHWQNACFRLVLKLRFLSTNTALCRAPDAWAISLSMSGSILTDDAITEQVWELRYMVKFIAIHFLGTLSSSVASLLTTINLVLGTLTDRPNALFVEIHSHGSLCSTSCSSKECCIVSKRHSLIKMTFWTSNQLPPPLLPSHTQSTVQRQDLHTDWTALKPCSIPARVRSVVYSNLL